MSTKLETIAANRLNGNVKEWRKQVRQYGGKKYFTDLEQADHLVDTRWDSIEQQKDLYNRLKGR